jgi:hypothetical protein
LCSQGSDGIADEAGSPKPDLRAKPSRLEKELGKAGGRDGYNVSHLLQRVLGEMAGFCNQDSSLHRHLGLTFFTCKMSSCVDLNSLNKCSLSNTFIK